MRITPFIFFTVSFASASFTTQSFVSLPLSNRTLYAEVLYSTQDNWSAMSVERLMVKLESTNAAERSTAAYYLSQYGKNADRAVVLLSQIVERDPDKWVRRSAVKALGRIGTPGAQKAIRLALGDSNDWVKHSARNALREAGYSQNRLGQTGVGQTGLALSVGKDNGGTPYFFSAGQQ